MKQEELNKILELHLKWLNKKDGGVRADLSGADLSGATLSGATLRGADLSGADIMDADLSGATLSGATLSGAYLSGADLSGAYLSGADLSGAYLSGADLSGADLSGADLSGAKANENTSFFFSQCPEGAFIGWKKCRDNSLVKLQITENAKRSSGTSLKCRCSEALVLSIEDKDGNSLKKAISKHDGKFIYEVGKLVKIDNFDEDRWNECSSGIHFFISKEMAKVY